MFLNIILTLIIVKLTRCSIVHDAGSEQTRFVAKYCPTMKHCREGTHVMCQYYDHNRVAGIHCRNFIKIVITSQMAKQILQGINDIRSQLALGKESGADGHVLPKAYGMMKMEWDSELATLAQVLANQCIGLKEDDCRATDKFSNPSQIITLINFGAPDWKYLSRNTTETGLNNEKLSFAIDKALSSLHGVKRLVTEDIVNDCPLLETLPNMGARSYLKLIRGRATHIGCGMSAYTRYHASNSPAQNIYNSVQIVCNISDGPQTSRPLYTTTPPIPGTGFTELCGCPVGYRESTGCLCENDVNEYSPATIFPLFHEENENEDSPVLKSEPRVVMLPIFEVQDAHTSYEPDDAEMAYHRRFGNMSFLPSESSVEETELSEEPYNEIPGVLKKNRNNKNRYSQNHKKFSSGRHDYQGYRNQDAGTTSDEFSSTEDGGNHQQYSRLNNDYEDKINAYKDNDITFLSILEMLERIVQNIKLDGNEKEMFDIKMRKIYESVIKEGRKITKPITAAQSMDTENAFLELKDYLKHKSNHNFEDDPDIWAKNARRLNKEGYLDRKYSEVFDQQNSIYEGLLDILKKKNIKDPFDRKYDTDFYNTGHVYDDNDEYTPTPAPRKQVAVIKYAKGLKETNSAKQSGFHNSDNGYNNKRFMNDYRDLDKHTYKNSVRNFNPNSIGENKRQFNVDQAIKTFGGKPFSYTENRARTAHHSPAYRRIYQ